MGSSLGRKRGGHTCLPLAAAQDRDELVLAHCVDKFSGDNVALVAGATLTIVKTSLVRLSTDNEYATAFSNGTFHEFGSTRTKEEVRLIYDRVNPVLPSPGVPISGQDARDGVPPVAHLPPAILGLRGLHARGVRPRLRQPAAHEQHHGARQ